MCAHKSAEISISRLFSAVPTCQCVTHPEKGLLMTNSQWCSLHPADWEINICHAFLTHPQSFSAKPTWLLRLHNCTSLRNHYFPPPTSFPHILHKEDRNAWDKIQNIPVQFVSLPTALLPWLKLNIGKPRLLVGTNTNKLKKGMINQAQVALTLWSAWGDYLLSMMALAGHFYVPNYKGFVISEQRRYRKA